MIDEKFMEKIKGKIGEYLDTYQTNISEAFEKSKALSISLPVKLTFHKGKVKAKVGFSMVEARLKVDCTIDESQTQAKLEL